MVLRVGPIARRQGACFFVHCYRPANKTPGAAARQLLRRGLPSATNHPAGQQAGRRPQRAIMSARCAVAVPVRAAARARGYRVCGAFDSRARARPRRGAHAGARHQPRQQQRRGRPLVFYWPPMASRPAAFCLACLLPPAIWTRFCSATYFIGILGISNQQIEVKLIT